MLSPQRASMMEYGILHAHEIEIKIIKFKSNSIYI